MSLTITIPGAVNVTTGAMAPAVLTIGVGVPGAQGPQGPAGPGVPVGGTAGQYLQKIDGTNYNTDWVTLNLSAYAPLASPAFTGNPTAPTAALADNDTSIATTAFVQQELLSGTANAKNLEVYVRNQTGSTIPAGSIVYINGATGNRPTITLAQANNDANSAQTMGFTKTSIANNGFGFVVVSGEVENLNTSALTEGVQLYLSPTTAGTWTTTKPSAPQHLVYVGIVIRAHPTQGVILVAVQNGYELEELHDVSIGTLANNDLLAYESSTDLWKNKTFGALGLLTSSSLTGYATESWVTAGFAPLARGLPASGTVGQVLTKNSGTSYDASWATLIPGDRYLTSSLTSNTIGLGAKTFTVGTGLSYSPQQDVVISYDASNHMHALVTTYDSGTGALVVDVQSITGSGTYADWIVNVGGTTPLQSVEWGEILGTLGDQSDLATALNAKLEITDAETTYYPLTGNPSSFLVLADIAGKANLSGASFAGLVGTPAATTSTAGLNVPHGTAPTAPTNGDVWTTTSGLFTRINGSTQQYAALASNNTFSGATATYGSSTATGTIGVASGATISGSTKTVNIGTAGVSGSTTNITVGPVLGASTISVGGTTAASTLNLATGATLTATTKAVNIGTSGVAGSTTNITIGSTTGTSTTTLQGTTNGVTAAADTNSAALATTGFVIGQAASATPLVDGTAAVGTSLRYARQDHVHPTDTSRAALASPTFTGTPAAPTAAADTNTTQIATTAFVVAQAGSATPLVDGTAAVGTSLRYARQDHVHPTDTSRAALASPAFTGTPTAPTATAGTNTTQIATTAFVTAAVPAFATLMESRQFTNTTKAMSPRNVFWAIQSQDSIIIRRPSFTYTTTGTIQYNQVGEVSQAIRLSTSAASSCFGRPFGTSQVDQVGALLFRENFSGNYLFSRPLFLSGRSGMSGITDSTLTLAFYFGKAEGDAIGDLTRRGYGWKVTGGAGSRFVSLEMHNGTTLTSVASSFAVTNDVCFDWDIYADGTGNVTLYINGSQVATVSGGPTNYNGYTPAWWREEFSSSATPTSAFPTAYFSRGKLTQLNFV